jgi:hypothetical protein
MSRTTEAFLSRVERARHALRAIASRCGQRVLWAGLVVWFVSVGTGLAWLMAYDNTPGAPADAPSRWPAASALARDAGGPTLVMLAHPRCDCTRASLGELAELLARAPQRPRTFVVFIRPGGVAAAWEQTSTFDQATRIPGVTVVRDDHGDEADRFGSWTSGQTLLYDRDGQLVYSGGITGARGKSGENTGRSTVLDLLAGAHSTRATNQVFGCSLFAWLKGETKAQGEANGS